jgi:hypothetical protein
VKPVFITLMLCLLCTVPVFSSVQETLPSWHWAYEYIDALRLRGGFEELHQMNRPFTRGDVARGLIRIQDRLLDGSLSFSSFQRNLYDRLVREFQEEIEDIRGERKRERFSLGMRLQSDLDKPQDEKVTYKGIYRSKINVPLGKHATVYHGLSFDQYLVDDTGYIGKKWPGIVGYTEQAYIAAEWGRFRFKFGRDFLRWGSGKDGTLIFSDITRPLDHFLASGRLGPILYTFVVSALDDMELDPQTAERYGGETAQRYLSAHRLDVSLFQGRFQWAVTEVALYGGVNRQLNWNYLNPFMIYHLSQLNDGGRVNTLLTTDLIVYPIIKLAVYGSFLIDQEMHIHKTKSSELEPKEIAWIVGSQWADPVGVPGMTLSAEYAGVTNRTYKTVHPWEIFSHRNVTLGHPLGNDFDDWRVGISQWFLGRIKLKCEYGITRKGEGGVFTPWDQPWMDVPFEAGYSEPFPTGIIEKRGHLDLTLHVFPSTYWGLNAEFHMLRRENAYHVSGSDKNETYWRVGVWFDGDMILTL